MNDIITTTNDGPKLIVSIHAPVKGRLPYLKPWGK